MDILLCFISHKLKCFLGSKLFCFLLALASALAYYLVIETYLNYKALVMVRTFLTDENVFNLLLGIFLNDLLENGFEVVENRLLGMTNIPGHKAKDML